MAQHSAAGKGLRRSLNVWQAVGLSVAFMAPSMAANMNPQTPAGFVGRAVPLAFVMAAIGVLLVGYGFVRMTQYFQHSGSVYAFVGATLGPRTGVVAGVGLLGTYTFYGAVTAVSTGIFGTAFLSEIGVWPSPPTWAPLILGAVGLIGAWLLTVIPARRGTGVLLNVEGATVGLILLIIVVVLVRLLSGDAPDAQTFDLSVFSLPEGTPMSALFQASVFGFLSFAGFEAAATLGEETRNPRKNIPRAIIGTAIFGGLYYIIVTAITMMGFGTNDAGVAAFLATTENSSLIGQLGTNYIGSWVGTVITLGAAVSSFGCCLATVVGGSRLLYALGRDASGNSGIGRVSATGTPANAALAVSVSVAVIVAVSYIWAEVPFDIFIWTSTIGTLILLVAYLLTTIGAIRLLFVQRKLRVPMWEIVIPIAAVAVLGYTLYVNLLPDPYPASNEPAFWFPIIAAGWLVIALIGVFLFPGLTRTLGQQLTAAAGLNASAEYEEEDEDDYDDADRPAGPPAAQQATPTQAIGFGQPQPPPNA